MFVVVVKMVMVIVVMVMMVVMLVILISGRQLRVLMAEILSLM